ncbi:hypothetical protein BG004_003793 [Podila humilis]|nr:hypothetical protein BG004_003793 [Podila humilis]
MSTVAQRLAEAHETLLKLYTNIPILSPCLEKIKVNHAEFISLNSRLRQLQECVTAGQYRSDKIRKQLDSVFTLNKAECERAYHQEISQLKTFEDERRACLRKRDDVVTLKYLLQKERAELLEETRQLKRVNDSVFDRSKDNVANADFPEELYWQLEIKEYDVKIDALKRQLAKYNTALTCLARAANLSEAALMALLGFPDAAYKVWRVEYALKATQRMRLYLRVELSLTNAYTNEDSAREACPQLVPSLAKPIKISSIQGHFGTSAMEPTATSSTKRPHVASFGGEAQLRSYIAGLRSGHKNAELLVAQETERLNAMQAYRESIVPRIARIRRHVFQNNCNGGNRIEGWENEQGQPLLGSEADNLVRGGILEVEPTRTGLSHSSPLPGRRGSAEIFNEDSSDPSRDRRRSGSDQARVPDTENQEPAIDPNNPLTVHDGRDTLSAGRAPLSLMSPGNILGSEVLMQVDRERRQSEASARSKTRSKSRGRRALEVPTGNPDSHQSGLSALGNLVLHNSVDISSSGDLGGTPLSHAAQSEREGRRKSRGLFGFARSRRGSTAGGEDAVVPSSTTSNHTSIFSLSGRRNRSSVDISTLPMERTVTLPSMSSGNNISAHTPDSNEGVQRGHRRSIPSISVSNQDGVTTDQDPHPLRRTFFENASLQNLVSSTSSSSSSPSRPRVMSMDEYVGMGPVQRANADYSQRSSDFDPHSGSAPLIPSYEEHGQHQVVDPDSVPMMTSTMSFEAGLSSLVEYDEGEQMDSAARHGHDAYTPNYYNSTRITSQGGNISAGGRPYSGVGSSRIRSRSLSPHPMQAPYDSIAMVHHSDGQFTARSGRAPYQGHQYSLSDQPMPFAHPPDYVVSQPPEYSA